MRFRSQGTGHARSSQATTTIEVSRWKWEILPHTRSITPRGRSARKRVHQSTKVALTTEAPPLVPTLPEGLDTACFYPAIRSYSNVVGPCFTGSHTSHASRATSPAMKEGRYWARRISRMFLLITLLPPPFEIFLYAKLDIDHNMGQQPISLCRGREGRSGVLRVRRCDLWCIKPVALTRVCLY